MHLYDLSRVSFLFYSWSLIFLIVQDGFSQSDVSGESYFGKNRYVEYIAGDLPLVIAVPHGGSLKPSSISDRNCDGCIYDNDAFTQELAIDLNEALQREGCQSHIVFNHLHRAKLDANRPIASGAKGAIEAEEAWKDFHVFVERSKQSILKRYGMGLFLDLHGHAHQIQRVELGYLIRPEDLREEDRHLNQASIVASSSIRNLVNDSPNQLTHSALIRGPASLGHFLELTEINGVPSSADPFPFAEDPYFSGGYNTQRHGSRDSGQIDAIQIECPQNARFEADKRLEFAKKLANAIMMFLERHYLNNPSDACTTTEVKESPTTTMSPYPNPTEGLIHFGSDINNAKVEIYSGEGKKLLSHIVRGQDIDLSSFNLSSGLYLLRIIHKQASSTIKVIKL